MAGAAALLLISASVAAPWQEDEEDEGDSGDPPTLTITSDEADGEVLIGNQVRLTASLSGGTGDYDGDYLNEVTWSWSCPADAGDPSLWHELDSQFLSGGDAEFDVCADMVGAIVFHGVARTDLHATPQASVNLNILGPNAVTVSTLPAVGSTNTQDMEQTCLFHFRRDGEEIGRECPIEGIVQEKISHDRDWTLPGWQYHHWWNGDWRPTLANAPTTTFYFNTDPDPDDDIPLNVGVDSKAGLIDAHLLSPPFAARPDGSIVPPSEVQQLRLHLPKVCGGHKIIDTTGGWRVQVRKQNATTIEFEFDLMPQEPVTETQPPPPGGNP